MDQIERGTYIGKNNLLCKVSIYKVTSSSSLCSIALSVPRFNLLSTRLRAFETNPPDDIIIQHMSRVKDKIAK